MSERGVPSEGRAGGYQRSSSGLLGAMIATVVLVLLFVGFRALTRDNTSTPVPAIDYTISLQAGRSAHQLMMYAPPTLPARWKATSASYTPGAEPAWHLGMLTDQQRYVGVEEAVSAPADLVSAKVNAQATPQGSVTIAGRSWQVYAGGGDYAVVRAIARAGKDSETLLVVGTAPRAAIRELAGSLTTG